jgi:hypothetical protein
MLLPWHWAAQWRRSVSSSEPEPISASVTKQTACTYPHWQAVGRTAGGNNGVDDTHLVLMALAGLFVTEQLRMGHPGRQIPDTDGMVGRR